MTFPCLFWMESRNRVSRERNRHRGCWEKRLRSQSLAAGLRCALPSQAMPSPWLSSDTLLAPSRHRGSPSTTDGTPREAAETREVRTERQGLQRGRYRSFLSGPLLLPPRCWSCQDVGKRIRGFQASWKAEKNRGIVGNQPLYCCYGHCTLNLIQQELVKGEAEPLVSTKAACSVLFISPRLTEVRF